MKILPNDNVRLATNAAWIVLVLLYFWPGGAILSQYETEILGWPVFSLWIVLIGPALLLLLYGVDSYHGHQQEHTQEESDVESPAASGSD